MGDVIDLEADNILSVLVNYGESSFPKNLAFPAAVIWIQDAMTHLMWNGHPEMVSFIIIIGFSGVHQRWTLPWCVTCCLPQGNEPSRQKEKNDEEQKTGKPSSQQRPGTKFASSEEMVLNFCLINSEGVIFGW